MTSGKQKSLVIHVKVRTGARKTGVQRLDTDTYKVAVTAPPVKGEANRQVVELLSSYFGVGKSFVKIVKGHKSRNKVVLIERITDGGTGDGNL